MNAVELSKLEALTKDYAVFQARKSGLATALGGLMAILLIAVPMNLDLSRFRIAGRSLLELMLFTPLAWLLLKQVLGRWFYRGLGVVKATPDPIEERRRWYWILGLALFLLAFMCFCAWGFALGLRGKALHSFERRIELPPGMSGPWVMGFPLLYLAAAPWWIRGTEEARAYLVLVGQCCLWLGEIFVLQLLCGAAWPRNPLFEGVIGTGFFGLLLLVLAWASLSMIRGWREHREYLAMLRSLPDAEEPV